MPVCIKMKINKVLCVFNKISNEIFNNILMKNSDIQEQEIARFAPCFGFAISIFLEIVGIYAIYWLISWSATKIVKDDFSNDFLYALIFLPIIDILKNFPNIFQSCFVRVGIGKTFIIRKIGVLNTNIDKLDVKNVDNIELDTNIFGELFNYGAITLYSIGGNIHLPFLKNPSRIYYELKQIIEQNKLENYSQGKIK